jgi:hypothetical protein
MQAVLIDAAHREAYEKSGYKKAFKAVKEAFLSDPKACSYHRARMSAKGKTIISTDEFEEVQTCINAIKSVGIIKEFFNKERGEHIETIMQADIYWEKDGLKFKALLDGITIDHEAKRIMPWDLKSTSAVISEFSESFWKWGYARQAAHYITGLIHNEHFAKLLSEGYIIGHSDDTAFKFIVSPKSERQAEGAVIYNMSWDICDIGIWGGEAFYGGKKHYVRGINELIEAYKWHMSTRVFTAPYWIISNNFQLQIEH